MLFFFFLHCGKLLGTCFKRNHHPLINTNESVAASRSPRARSSNVPAPKLATFHKQFHQLITQLGVYWEMADSYFGGAVCNKHTPG